MSRPDHRNQSGWRRVVGWFAAYLLVLHIFFAGVATGHFFAPEMTLSVTLCLNGAHDDSPTNNSHSKVHCVFCPAATHAAGTIEAPATLPVSFADASGSIRRFDRHSRPAEPEHRSQSARAPPLT